MEETTVTVINRYKYYPVSECMCDECGDIFVDPNDNYQYCPHCGRKIRWIVEDSRLHLGDSESCKRAKSKVKGTVKMILKVLNAIIEIIMVYLIVGIPIMMGLAIGWMICKS